METNYIFWVALVAYAIHILEEYTYDWKSWAQKVMKLDVEWSSFYVGSIIVLFIGLACAEVGWAHPTFSLIFPALMLVNALFFHILPYIRSNRKFSPANTRLSQRWPSELCITQLARCRRGLLRTFTCSIHSRT